MKTSTSPVFVMNPVDINSVNTNPAEQNLVNTNSVVTNRAYKNSVDSIMSLVADSDVLDKTNPNYDVLKLEPFHKAPWLKLVTERSVRYLYWPADQFHLKKYVEIDENLGVKVNKIYIGITAV